MKNVPQQTEIWTLLAAPPCHEGRFLNLPKHPGGQGDGRLPVDPVDVMGSLEALTTPCDHV